MPALQKHTINTYIKKRVERWAWSIRDPKFFNEIIEISNVETPTDEDKAKIKALQEDVIASTIVTGGAIASMLLGEEVNDLDIYFTNRETARKVATYYLNSMAEKLPKTDHVRRISVIDNKESGVEIYIKSQGITGEDVKSSEDYRYFENGDDNVTESFFNDYVKTGATKLKEGAKKQHIVSFMSSNAVTLQSGIQIILRFTGTTDEIHENFDFVHCTNYWTAKGGVVYNPDALEAILERRLYYIGSKFPLASLFRLRKFIERDWRVSGGEITKIGFDTSLLDLTDVGVLRDQLMGMDLAYFHEVINILKRECPDRNLDRTYLFLALDRVFRMGEKPMGVDDE